MVLGFALNIISIARASDATEDDLADDISEYNGSLGPENALYGLKLSFENIDESFTWNTTEKIGKKVLHSRLRISEAKAELKKKNNEAAQKAFEYYSDKATETEESISGIQGNDSGILKAQKMIKKHQYVLEQLLGTNPNNNGLKNAYNKSLELENNFEQKTEIKLERVQNSEGKYIIKEIETEEKENTKDKQAEVNPEGSQEIKGAHTEVNTGGSQEIKVNRDEVNAEGSQEIKGSQDTENVDAEKSMDISEKRNEGTHDNNDEGK